MVSDSWQQQPSEPKNGRLQLRRHITLSRDNTTELVKDIESRHSLASLMERLKEKSYV